MLQTIVRQTYTGNTAPDTSGFFNHGIPIEVSPARPGFAFANGRSRINVLPSPTLAQLGLIQLTVAFRLSPNGLPQRQNLAEGFQSFALFVGPDLSLSGTILDANGNWTGATSKPSIVTTNKTHTAILQCDGINMVRLFLDGAPVAASFHVDGAVRGVGQLGVAIGHWSDEPDTCTFHGTIFSFVLQRYDPRSDLSFLNGSCFDAEALKSWFAAKQKNGITADKLARASKILQTSALTAARAMHDEEEHQTLQHQELTAALRFALKRQDLRMLETTLKQLSLFTDHSVSAKHRIEVSQNVAQALELFGLSFEDWTRFMAIFCLPPVKCRKQN